MHLNLGVAQDLTSHDSAEVDITKAHKAFACGCAIRALEVTARDDRLLVVGALHGTVLGRDSLHNRRVVVHVGVLFFVRNDRLPLLLVEREHQVRCRTNGSFRCVEHERIVINLRDGHNATDILASHTFNKLSIERLIIADRAIVILELSKADATDLNTRLSCRGSSLRVEVMHEHVLVVGEGVLWVAIVQCQIGTVVLAIARRR